MIHQTPQPVNARHALNGPQQDVDRRRQLDLTIDAFHLVAQEVPEDAQDHQEIYQEKGVVRSLVVLLRDHLFVESHQHQQQIEEDGTADRLQIQINIVHCVCF